MADGSSRGARVLRTGIALVHEGELVLPAVGSEAQAEQVLDDERAVVQYHFPVEIEVRGAETAVDLDAIVDRALSRLAQGLEGA
ncbi:MAG TPA: hypothetical protein VF062_12570 [Candidatus Limnocylindrales bacterium]